MGICLAIGFTTATKGWDIIRKMKIPTGWRIVINASRNHYNMESYIADFEMPGIINLNRGYLNEEELSLLCYSVDAVILPYRVCSASGVLFSGLAHKIPFISSDVEFFKEFSQLGLGISAKRNPAAFSSALLELERGYGRYKRAAEGFSRNLTWKVVASKHLELYRSIIQGDDSYLPRENTHL